MIVRKWSAVIRSGQADEYIAYVERTGGTHYAEIDGNLGYQILLGDLGDGTSEISTVSWWTDLDAVRGFAGEDYDTARYYPEDDQYLLSRPELLELHKVRSSNLARLGDGTRGMETGPIADDAARHPTETIE